MRRFNQRVILWTIALSASCWGTQERPAWQSGVALDEAIAACRAAFDPRQGHGLCIPGVPTVTGGGKWSECAGQDTLAAQLQTMCPADSNPDRNVREILTAGSALCLAAYYGLPPGLDGYTPEFHCREEESVLGFSSLERIWYVQTFTQTDCPFPPSSRGRGITIDARTGELLDDRIGFTQFHTCPQTYTE